MKIRNDVENIPHFELIISGLPFKVHHRLDYQQVKREEANELFVISFQVVSYLL
tara:strand:- start:367 stop:528 length:162 start_codon:yes stop_codon:yes gene_type:complete